MVYFCQRHIDLRASYVCFSGFWTNLQFSLFIRPVYILRCFLVLCCQLGVVVFPGAINTSGRQRRSCPEELSSPERIGHYLVSPPLSFLSSRNPQSCDPDLSLGFSSTAVPVAVLNCLAWLLTKAVGQSQADGRGWPVSSPSLPTSTGVSLTCAVNSVPLRHHATSTAELLWKLFPSMS